MRILMALDYYRPYVSGLAVYVERLGHALAARGHRVTVLTHRHAESLPGAEEGDGIRIVRAPVLTRVGKALVAPALLREARRELRRADVFHLHAPLATAAPLAAIASSQGVPFIVTYHCDLRTPAGLSQRLVEAIARGSQNFALDRAARVVTYTEDYARNTESLAERPERVGWILPPVPDPRPSALDREAARRRYGIRGGPVLLFLGRFAEEKGLPVLLSAFDLLRRTHPDAALVLAGEKDAVPGERVGERLAPLLADPSSGIVATGLVPPDRVAELFAAADVLVLPSLNSTESFGLVQVEAMLCGVPSVASDLPGVRQPVRMTGMGEIARIGDAQDLAEKIAKVLASPGTYRRSRAQVRAVFSIDRTCAEYEAVYETALRA
ncbi:MAG TPA: glycosyltransferase family 4 protein [Thermoanaerobaculia bacterium]|nr:glycosyltransferase family 4 protein [Thermoanaerobaculia bacterium]